MHRSIAADGRPLLNSFGLGNWTGLAALVLVVGLLALSSDAALRKLKAGPWKRLQRLNYALFALVILHAFFYGSLLRTTSPFAASVASRTSSGSENVRLASTSNPSTSPAMSRGITSEPGCARCEVARCNDAWATCAGTARASVRGDVVTGGDCALRNEPLARGAAGCWVFGRNHSRTLGPARRNVRVRTRFRGGRQRFCQTRLDVFDQCEPGPAIAHAAR